MEAATGHPPVERHADTTDVVGLLVAEFSMAERCRSEAQAVEAQAAADMSRLMYELFDAGIEWGDMHALLWPTG